MIFRLFTRNLRGDCHVLCNCQKLGSIYINNSIFPIRHCRTGRRKRTVIPRNKCHFPISHVIADDAVCIFNCFHKCGDHCFRILGIPKNQIMDGLFFDIPFGPYMIVYFVSIDILMSSSYNRCINQFVYTCRHSRINCNFMCRSSFRSNEWHGDQNNCIRIFKCFRQFFRIVKIGNSGFNAHCLVFFKTIFCWSRKNQSFMRISFQQYTG